MQGRVGPPVFPFLARAHALLRGPLLSQFAAGARAPAIPSAGTFSQVPADLLPCLLKEVPAVPKQLLPHVL